MKFRDWIFIFILASANGFIVPKSAWIVFIIFWLSSTVLEIIKQKKGKQKMTKKQAKEKAKQARVLVPFNTGTRTMKSAKYPTRQERKKIREEW